MPDPNLFVLNATFIKRGAKLETEAKHSSVDHLRDGFKTYMEATLEPGDEVLEGVIYQQWPDGRRDEALIYDTTLGAWIVKLAF